MSRQINKLNEVEVTQFNLREGASLNSYQTLATGTAIYPGQGEALGLAYTALKLNGEAGEFAEQVGKAMRDDAYMDSWQDPESGFTVIEPNELEDDRKAAMVKELGDTLWYISAAATELGLTLHDIAKANLNKLVDRQKRNTLQGSGNNR